MIRRPPEATQGPALEGWAYGRVHAAACWLALRRWVWRWAVFAAVAVLVATGGAGVDTALGVARALAAWAALPLARGAAAGGIWAPLAVLGCAGVGLALLASVRQRLWPTAWREAERALPLAPRATRLSDLRIVALASLPWAGLQGLGLLAWLAQSPPWLGGRAAAVGAAGLAALALMLAGGVLMQQLRRRGGPPRRAGLAATVQRPRPWALSSRVLLLWPLGRGVAPRSARHALATAGAGGLLMAAAAWRPAWAQAWLGLQALLVLAAVARAQALAALELRPLLAACAALPLSQRAWGWRLDAAAATPALAGVAGLAAVVLVTAPAVHAPVLAAWAGWLVLAVALVLRVPLADAALQSARWLFLLAVAVALGSEVLP
ncbi:MAG: hypothetical protein ACK5ZF_02745 [Betaproteobacteria bacterium]